jgi:hypothetical protein
MGSILSGIDFCFDPTNPGTPDAEGHYPLGFGLIERSSESAGWTKVNGFSENVTKNTDFVISFYDMSGTQQQVDMAVIAWRPDSDDTTSSPSDSPFSSSDFDAMIEGKALSSSGNGQTCGCGVGGSLPYANAFPFGTYTLKNTGEYEVTVELRITYNGQTMEFKCDPKIIVGT